MALTTGPDAADLLAPSNRSRRSPLWSQVKNALTLLILKGDLSEHAQLPSEAELCLRFGVSRTVVREALAQMVNERLIYKLQGKGAFVAGRREEQDFVGTTVGFSGELAELAKTRADVAEQIDGQRKLFFARKESLMRQSEQLDKRNAQISSQIDGIDAQTTAVNKQLGLIQQELTDQQKLRVEQMGFGQQSCWPDLYQD